MGLGIALDSLLFLLKIASAPLPCFTDAFAASTLEVLDVKLEELARIYAPREKTEVYARTLPSSIAT